MDTLNIENSVSSYQMLLENFSGSLEITQYTSLIKPAFYLFELVEYHIDRISGDSKGDLRISFQELVSTASYNSGVNINTSRSFIIPYGKTQNTVLGPRKMILKLQNPGRIVTLCEKALGTSAFVGTVLLTFNISKISDL